MLVIMNLVRFIPRSTLSVPAHAELIGGPRSALPRSVGLRPR